MKKFYFMWGILLMLGIGTFALVSMSKFPSVPTDLIQGGAPDAFVFDSFTHASTTTVTSTGKLILAADSSRQYALFTNDSANPLYLELGTASTTAGSYVVRLNASGGTFEITPEKLFVGPVYATSTFGLGGDLKILLK